MTRDQPENDAEPTEREDEQLSAENAGGTTDQPDSSLGEQRLLELLRTDVRSGSIEDDLNRRTAASRALTRLAHEDVEPILGHVDFLLDELQAERIRGIPAELTQARADSDEVTDNLVRTIALVVAERPDTVTENEDVSAYIRSISTDLKTETLRVVTEAFFSSASELQQPDAAIETLGELTTYPDGAVQAWSAAALGRFAEENPDAVASNADALRHLLEQDDETVQHNAVEAVGSLVSARPDAVAPAADTLRELLDHEEVAIQHNAAGVLGQLASTHLDAVAPAVESLERLCDHEDDAVRRIATRALVRLVQERPAAVTDG